MKKTVLCLTMVLLLILGNTALASSASYKDGYVTVSTERTGFFEIHIDGRVTYRWVGHVLPSQTFKYELSEGTHTVTLYSPDTGSATNITLVVGEGDQQGETTPDDTTPDVQPDDKSQPTPPDGEDLQPQPDGAADEPEQKVEYPDSPFTMLSAEYVGGTLSYAFYGLHGYAEVWLDGKDTGRIVRKNGEHTLSVELEEGEHELKLYAVSTDELIKISFSVKHSDPNIEKYGISLITASGEDRDFSLQYEDEKLTVCPKEMENFLRVRYSVSSLALMMEDGYILIAVDCGAEHAFRMNEIASAFNKLNLKGDDWVILTALPSDAEESAKLYAFSEGQNILTELSVEEATEAVAK